MVAILQNSNGLLDLGWTPVLLGGAVLLLIVSNTVSTVRQYYRLRHIKGPLLACFSKLWLLKRVGGGRAHLDLYEVCEKYGKLLHPLQRTYADRYVPRPGSIARIGPNDVVTSEPDLMKRMLNVRTKYKRSDWYYAMRFDPAKDNVLSMRNDQEHNKLRAKMAHGV